MPVVKDSDQTVFGPVDGLFASTLITISDDAGSGKVTTIKETFRTPQVSAMALLAWGVALAAGIARLRRGLGSRARRTAASTSAWLVGDLPASRSSTLTGC